MTDQEIEAQLAKYTFAEIRESRHHLKRQPGVVRNVHEVPSNPNGFPPVSVLRRGETVYLRFSTSNEIAEVELAPENLPKYVEALQETLNDLTGSR